MSARPLLKGRPISLGLLDYGLFRVHDGPRTIGICGYLIQTDAGEAVLVDLGFPPAYAADPEAASKADALTTFGTVLTCTAENTPAAQLAKAGLTEADIDLLVLTHSHIDHIGDLAFAPEAPLILSAAERALPRPLYWGDRQPLDWPDRETLALERDTDLAAGLRVLMAPGHTPGQIALLLELPQTGSVLLTSDAISRPSEIFATDRERQTAARLLQIAEKKGAVILYGHDPAQWPSLRKVPDLYL
ncbi:N-acyl homoserine lactonase family protein [Aestuariibius insulae]|uniref:N-acyl homoserine lactonase family protein n=1 Tax=Aestuariibius insulae TaxID=2058287 RepID=UPI00345E92C0